ncbi:MAG: CoA pyrophosphatase [Archaeoglobaceae archaeon]|nr:CoA pyrophosphatase [Archaeoglobaceae archaeon]
MLKKMLKEILNSEIDGKVRAAVLVPILECSSSKIVMIKRGTNLTRSAGHVAFPGGMIEEGEDVVETALREFEEELGVRRDRIEVLGFLKSREVLEYRIKICPVVGITQEDYFAPDSREVSKVLIDGLERVLLSRRVADWGANFDCAGELVWGASSRVLDDLYLRIISRFGSIKAFFNRLREIYVEKY